MLRVCVAISARQADWKRTLKTPFAAVVSSQFCCLSFHINNSRCEIGV